MKIPFFEKLRIWRFINKCFRFDKRVFVKYSRAIKVEGGNHILAQTAINTHVIEKGLTMPEMRQGFGQEKIHQTIMLCRSWAESYDKSNPIYVQAVRTILEYRQLHQNLNYTFGEPFRTELDTFADENTNISASSQLSFAGAEQFFSQKESAFPQFARSRHSVRNFTDADIPLQRMIDAIELAQCAPSACNRQSTRVHIITDKTAINSIMALQNGNRGFGHLTNKLLVVTFLISNYGSVKERNLGYIDSGIFTMNLLYALHYNQIAACTLNWCDSRTDNAKLRSVVPIPDNEKVSLLIACGVAPEKQFKVARSHRLDGKSITTIH